MRIARTILALVAAWSIAAAPAVAGYAPAQAGVPPVHASELHHDHAAAMHAPHHAMAQDQADQGSTAAVPCLHDEHAPAQKPADGCASMAGCPLCYPGLPALQFTLAEPIAVVATLAWHPSEPAAAAASAGPFRPPRI